MRWTVASARPQARVCRDRNPWSVKPRMHAREDAGQETNPGQREHRTRRGQEIAGDQREHRQRLRPTIRIDAPGLPGNPFGHGRQRGVLRARQLTAEDALGDRAVARQ